MFAFSLVLLELAVGDARYVHGNYKGRSGYALGHRPYIPPSLKEALPYLAKLIEKGWSQDPSKRPEFHEIEEILEENSATGALRPFVPPPPRLQVGGGAALKESMPYSLPGGSGGGEATPTVGKFRSKASSSVSKLFSAFSKST